MAIKKCRVCGAEYTACKNAARNPYGGTFRWQEVACSPECGSEYFRLIQKSRGVNTASPEKVSVMHTDEAYEEGGFDEDAVESIFDDPEPDEFGNT